MDSHIEKVKHLLARGRFNQSVHKTLDPLKEIESEKPIKIDGKYYTWYFDETISQVVLVNKDSSRRYHIVTFLMTDYNYDQQQGFLWANTNKTKGDLFH